MRNEKRPSRALSPSSMERGGAQGSGRAGIPLLPVCRMLHTFFTSLSTLHGTFRQAVELRDAARETSLSFAYTPFNIPPTLELSLPFAHLESLPCQQINNTNKTNNQSPIQSTFALYKPPIKRLHVRYASFRPSHKLDLEFSAWISARQVTQRRLRASVSRFHGGRT